MNIALVTCRTLSEFESYLENEDELLISYLKKHQIETGLYFWDDENVDWKAFDLVMIKSTWDYFNRPVEFKAWLYRMKALEINLQNPVDVLLWNMDKIYLKDLEAKGIQGIPTVWIDKNTDFDLENAQKTLKTDHVIIKPRISGGAKNTFIANVENLDQATEKLRLLVKHEDFMVQPFLSEIRQGEESYLFFNNQFSHAIRKIPANGDFRVQHYFGGKIEAFLPTKTQLEQAQKVSDLFASDCLYARVDGIPIDGRLHIIELEVIEPLLFLYSNEASFGNLRKAISLKASLMA